MSIVESVAKTSFRIAYEISPVILVDGVAENIPGKMLPIAVLTEHIGIADGLLRGDFNFEEAKTHFSPMPGGTLVVQDIATYPFLDLVTAANATVQKPNRISMRMLKPASSGKSTYTNKVLEFSALKMVLDNHNQQGGTYNVLTPSYIYTGCLLRSLMDSSSMSENNKQVQYEWIFEFEQPLLTTTELNVVMNGALNAIDNGVKSLNEGWSGVMNAVKGVLPW